MHINVIALCPEVHAQEKPLQTKLVKIRLTGKICLQSLQCQTKQCTLDIIAFPPRIQVFFTLTADNTAEKKITPVYSACTPYLPIGLKSQNCKYVFRVKYMQPSALTLHIMHIQNKSQLSESINNCQILFNNHLNTQKHRNLEHKYFWA